MNNFIKAMIYQMSRRTDTPLTDQHLNILEFANEYYYKHKVGPLYQIFKQKLGVTREDLESLFPNGLQSVYSWAGIPIQGPGQVCKPIAEVEVNNFREVYFDHNATTYLRAEITALLSEYFQGDYGYGNPSSSTRLGKTAYEHLFNSRAHIAKVLDVSSPEIYFTSCGSESNNLAIKGVAFNHLRHKGHIISSKIEHPSVLEPLSWLAQIGFDITLVDVGPDGIVSPQSIQDALRKDTILVAVMAVNNELGTINPIEAIGQICQTAQVPFMVDAIQAFGKIPIAPKKSGISLLSISGHKIYAPKGTACLFVDERVTLSPLIHGGKQEFGLRSGTENVGSIIALGEAVRLRHAEREKSLQHLSRLHRLFLEQLDRHVPGYILNGSAVHRVPGTLNIGFPNIDSGALLLSLNHIGVYVSSGSACSAGSKESSHVIRALGVDTDHYGIIRFSFGKENTEEDIAYLFQYLPNILEQLRDN